MIDSKEILANMAQSPGVYQMINAAGEVLYVGKARNLKKRVASYFRKSGLPPKTLAMVQHVAKVEVITTHTESEALLLENNLIKRYRPRYNVTLRDDKSYPYIHLDDSQEFPRLGFYRGSRQEAGKFFGPYANAGAVRETLSQLQKIFPVRQCEDTYYRLRSRPCLQYQIKRCTAPCVGLVEREKYLDDVRQAELFLSGKNERLREYLIEKMEAASERLDYETAARYRDRITALQKIQEQQYINSDLGDVDVVVLEITQSVACVEVLFVRGGWHNGSKAFYPTISLETSPGDLMTSFLGQFYINKPVPDEILTQPAPSGRELLAQALRDQAGHKVEIRARTRGQRARWLEMAALNATLHLQQHLSGRASQAQRLEALRDALDLDDVPQRIECFDISHTGGEATVASCVVFAIEGPVKTEYRRYNIKNVTPGDDYAALEQALTRRYEKLQAGEGKLPDLLLIDGGKGQVGVANRVLEELQLSHVPVLGIAKGPARKPGMEKLFVWFQQRPLQLSADSPALHGLQQVRDEAHRFAISGHRRQRGKIRVHSTLQEIPGIGSKRRQALLKHLGGMQGVARAGIEDLHRVPGISAELARKIYDHFHGE